MALVTPCCGRDCSCGRIPPITLQKRRRGERGAALVEFALAVPLLLVVIAGIVDFGFAFQRYEVITNAAREGARMATLPGTPIQRSIATSGNTFRRGCHSVAAR